MSGKTDILSISVVGFLTLSLVAVVSVVINPDVKQLFAPKAIDLEYDLPTIVPPPEPTTQPEPEPVVVGYDKDIVINTTAKINEPGYDCNNGGCAAGVEVAGYYLSNGKFYPVGGTGNNPDIYKGTSQATVNEERAKAEEAAKAARNKALAEKAATVQEAAKVAADKASEEKAKTEEATAKLEQAIGAPASSFTTTEVTVPIAVPVTTDTTENMAPVAVPVTTVATVITNTAKDILVAITQPTQKFYSQKSSEWRDYEIKIDYKNMQGNIVQTTKTMKQIGCGPTTVANILNENGIKVTPTQIAQQIPSIYWFSAGTTFQPNIDILKKNGFTADFYTKSLYNLTKYTKPDELIWITAEVEGIGHHTYIDGYTIENGKTVFTMRDPFFGTDLKCSVTSGSTFGCDGSGKHYSYDTTNEAVIILTPPTNTK